MKKVLSVLIFVTVASAGARADSGNVIRNPDTLDLGDHVADNFGRNQQAGQAQADQQNLSQNPSQGVSNPSTQTALTNERQASDAAKVKLAPDAIRMQTSLMGALDQLKGLRTQLKATEAAPVDKQTLAPLRSFGKEINTEVSRAELYQSQLKSKAGSYRDVLDSDSFKSLKNSLTDAKTATSQWESKTASADYWKNRDQAMNDLDRIERHLSDALDKARVFSSTKLGASIS